MKALKHNSAAATTHFSVGKCSVKGLRHFHVYAIKVVFQLNSSTEFHFQFAKLRKKDVSEMEL